MNYEKLLEGRTAFINSASQGIGKEIALLFAMHGARVAIGGRNAVKLAATLEELSRICPDSKGYQCDLSRPEETEAVCERVKEELGAIDILVNTVGVNLRCATHEIVMEQMEQLLETNYISGVRCMKHVLPGMIARQQGIVIHISSIHGIMTMPGNFIYAGTKGAINASARATALDYADKGIRVNTICPGVILSDAVMEEIRSYPEGKEREEFMRLLESMQPMKPGSSADVANAALYLASDMSAYVTGQILMVDGGASIKAH